jgi:hypothetical protein
MQINFLNLLQRIFPDVKLYSVNENCLINEHINLASMIYDEPWYTPEQKPKDRLSDYLPLPETMPSKLAGR